MNATQTPAERIEATAAELGLTMDAKFIPWSQSSNAGEKQPSLNWKVTIHKKGRMAQTVKECNGYDILTIDYSAGCGHCPSYKASVKELGNRDSIMRDEAIRKECETGHAHQIRGIYPKQIMPKLADVLSSLVMDSDALDCGSFDEWAEALGYDTDSRKAEAIYRACLETGLKLRNALGEKGLQQLREACQDY